MVRAFVAIDVNEDVRRKLVAAQEQLSATGAQLKLVEPSNIHVTMKFLGEVPDHRIDEIANALRNAAAGVKRFVISVRRIGVFPNLRYIRVVWAGVAGGRDEVIDLQRRIDRELRPLGFAPERDFVPHLTLARVKSAARREELVAAVKRMSTIEFGASEVYAIELKQSTLTSKGPIYSTLAQIELS